MTYISRSEWSDDKHSLSPAQKGVGYAVIHHTVGAYTGGDKKTWLRNLEHAVTDHPAPGNSSSLVAIDYSELIFPDGTVAEGRGFAHEDAATYQFNAKSVSWALIGNYDTNPVPDVMIHALAERIQSAIQQGWLKPQPTIEGHRDVGTFATACPGRFTEQRLSEVRSLVASPTEDEDMTEDEKKLLFATVAELHEKVNWCLNSLIPGGYDHRTGTPDAHQPYLHDVAAEVAAIKTKVGA